MKQLVIILCAIALLVSAGIIFVKKLDFEQNCSGRLERAATANTVELATTELDVAINYAEEKGYTHGYTSVLYRTPDEDVAFWYNNLVASRAELVNLPDSASTLEKTNTLMKLRESLTDTSDGKTKVIYPDGLAFYPHNFGWGILRLFLCIVIIGGILAFYIND